MTPKETLINALKPLNLPVSPLVNTSSTKPSSYITYQFYNDAGNVFADDEEVETRFLVSVDVYSLSNPDNIAKNARNLLENAGFDHSYTTEFYENETKYYHKVSRFIFDLENEN
jgi:hypothetical protein